MNDRCSIREEVCIPLYSTTSANEHQLRILFQEANMCACERLCRALECSSNGCVPRSLEQKAGTVKAVVERVKTKRCFCSASGTVLNFALCSTAMQGKYDAMKKQLSQTQMSPRFAQSVAPNSLRRVLW